MLTDHGRFHRSSGTWREHALHGVEQAAELLREAHERGIPVRIRGRAHSMNGTAVPRDGELLLTTDSLSHFAFEEEGTVTVGAGAAVWDVDRMLETHGFSLLMCNDGGAAASSVGGFASAGGIGERSWLHGGFWETVAELTLVTRDGAVLRCTPEHPLFRWVFGAMGRLGVIVEAKLRIEPLGSRPYPMGVRGTIARSEPQWPHDVWLTLFVPPPLEDAARGAIADLGRRHRHAWTPRHDFRYFIRFLTFNPPLVYPRNESFVAVGLWGTAADDDFPALRALERDFAALAASHPSYRRYIQTELTFEDVDYPAYFGSEVWEGWS